MQLEVVINWQSDLKKWSLERMDYKSRIVDMHACINSLEGTAKLLQAIKGGGQRGKITALHKRFAIKHGRKYTGRKRERPKKLVDTDGKKRPVFPPPQKNSTTPHYPGTSQDQTIWHIS
jgi:hypothetical protein